MQDTKMQNSLENETCFRGFEIRPKFSETQIFKVPFYTLQPQETFQSEYLLGLVYDHFGRTAKQPPGERWYSHMWAKQAYAFCLSDSGTRYKTQPSSLEDG